MNNGKIDIHFFIHSLGGGGAQQVTIRLLKYLNRKLFQPTIILVEKRGPFVDKVPTDVPIVDLKVRHVRYALPKLMRHLHRKRPDILFSVMGYTNVIALLAQRFTGIPTKVFASVHNTLSKSTKNRRNIRAKVILYLERRLYPKAERVIAVSQGVKDDISDYLGIRKEKIAMIYNPIVDGTIFELTQESVNHPWFHNSEIPVIIAVGALTKQKNYLLLFRAFKLILARHPARLVILGEGRQRAHLENIAKELGITDNVALLGFQGNPYKFMAKASAFVLSSSWEGLPTVLVEAMACGVPVVSTDCTSGPSEIISRPGHNGLLVPVDQPEALADAILQILENKELATRFAKAASERAEDFGAARITREYEELFKSVLWIN